MSWGERSCLNRSNCPVVCTIDTCNTFKREFAAKPVSDPLKGLNREQRRALKKKNKKNLKGE